MKIDGVKDAELKAADIVKNAEAKADEIVAKAKKEASRIIAGAKEEAVKSEQSGREALKQAGRDLVLNLQTKITDLFNIIIKKEVASAMDDKVLAETIVKLIGSWKSGTENLQVLLSEKDYRNVENVLRTTIADQIKKGFEV